MASVFWSVDALADIERLDDFLRPKSTDAANRAAAAILDGVAGLEQFPRIGRPISHLPLEFRELLVLFGRGGYRVMYQVVGDDVLVLAVRHSLEAGYRSRPDV